MKTYTFPYGAAEWDGTIDVELSDKQAALLEKAMKNKDNFHLSDDPSMADIERKVEKKIFKEMKKQLIEDGRMEELREFDPDMDEDELVYEELGDYYVNFPERLD